MEFELPLILPGLALFAAWLAGWSFGGGATFRKALTVGLAGYLFYSAAYTDTAVFLKYCREWESGNSEISGKVVSCRSTVYGAYLELVPTGCNPGNSLAKVRIFSSAEPKVGVGDTVEVRGEVSFSKNDLPRHWIWWHPFDLAGYTIKADSRDISLIKQGGFSLRQSLLEQFAQVDTLTTLARGLLEALVFGSRVRLDPDLYQQAKELGVAHLLALSGMHLGLYVLLVSLLLGRRLPGVSRAVALVLFAALSGGGSAPIRAVAAGVYGLMGLRHPMAGNETFARVLLLLLWLNPSYLFDLGFRFSFLAVLALGLFSRISSREARGSTWSNMFGASCFVSAAILPVQTAYFGYFSPWGPVLSLTLLPLVGGLVLVGLAGIPFLTMGLGNWYFELVGPITNFLGLTLKTVLSTVEGLQLTTIQVGAPGIGVMFAGGLCLASVFRAHTTPDFSLGRNNGFQAGVTAYLTVAAVILASALFGAIGVWCSPWLAVTALDVGHGDAVHLSLPGGAQMLVDGGGSSEVDPRDWVGRQLTGYLVCSGITDLDSVFISHWHEDHYGGLVPVALAIPIRTVISPGGLSLPLLTGGSRPENLVSFQTGLQAKEHGVALKMLYPSTLFPSILTSPNMASGVILLSYKDFSLLFTGDLPSGQQREVAEILPGSVSILKVPHHGGRWLTRELIEAARPQVALISGEGPHQGQPRAETIKLLSEVNALQARTDLSGSIRFRTDGQRFWIETTVGAEGNWDWRSLILQVL